MPYAHLVGDYEELTEGAKTWIMSDKIGNEDRQKESDSVHSRV